MFSELEILWSGIRAHRKQEMMQNVSCRNLCFHVDINRVFTGQLKTREAVTFAVNTLEYL